MTEDGSFMPLANALAGGFLSLIAMVIPVTMVIGDYAPIIIEKTELCQSLQCMASRDVVSATDLLTL